MMLDGTGNALGSARVTVKPAPSFVTADGVTSDPRPRPPVIEIACAPDWTRLTVWPSLVAVASVNVTEPKLSNGRIDPRPLLGASSIHSADESVDWYWTVRLYVAP